MRIAYYIQNYTVKYWIVSVFIISERLILTSIVRSCSAFWVTNTRQQDKCIAQRVPFHTTEYIIWWWLFIYMATACTQPDKRAMLISFNSRGSHWLENRTMRRIFGPKRNANWEWRRLHIEELHSFVYFRTVHII